ncbi:hypothetical protein PR202_gb25888 [Eleusine coracana subsp. coracana]|uniref:Uncharacterized protein n=1 Tax=Eleusine coracana subsp. coracana TaxID=191504 RepID=A0AAV5FQ60_ELECO|nr:hypothetical protein PR202_gb25888 [Eleusine coracana subsp. coracana]
MQLPEEEAVRVTVMECGEVVGANEEGWWWRSYGKRNGLGKTDDKMGPISIAENGARFGARDDGCSHVGSISVAETAQDSVNGWEKPTSSPQQTLTEAQKEAKRARDKARYAKMTPEQRKARQAKQILSEGQKEMKRAREKARYNQCPNAALANRKQIPTEEQKEARRIYDRNRYAKMTSEQRVSRLDKRKKPENHQKENACSKKRREALCPESIAMENPIFVPELVFPDGSTQQIFLDGSTQQKPNLNTTTEPFDISMLGPTWRPLYIPSIPDKTKYNYMENAIDVPHVTRHQNVPHGNSASTNIEDISIKPKNTMDDGSNIPEPSLVDGERVVYENNSDDDDERIWLGQGN